MGRAPKQYSTKQSTIDRRLRRENEKEKVTKAAKTARKSEQQRRRRTLEQATIQTNSTNGITAPHQGLVPPGQYNIRWVNSNTASCTNTTTNNNMTVSASASGSSTGLFPGFGSPNATAAGFPPQQQPNSFASPSTKWCSGAPTVAAAAAAFFPPTPSNSTASNIAAGFPSQQQPPAFSPMMPSARNSTATASTLQHQPTTPSVGATATGFAPTTPSNITVSNVAAAFRAVNTPSTPQLTPQQAAAYKILDQYTDGMRNLSVSMSTMSEGVSTLVSVATGQPPAPMCTVVSATGPPSMINDAAAPNSFATNHPAMAPTHHAPTGTSSASQSAAGAFLADTNPTPGHAAAAAASVNAAISYDSSDDDL